MFPYTVIPADPTSPLRPVIASVPHCGTYVPLDIDVLFANERQRALPMTDWYLHHLYDFLPKLGVTLIFSNVSRNVVDLNRSLQPIELYPGRFETKLVADKTFQGEDIFSRYPSQHQINQHAMNVYLPYHRALNSLLKDRVKQFGKAYLFDLHSIAPHATVHHPYLEKDIYLGNRDGQSCDVAWFAGVDRLLQNCGFTTQENHPYKGGFITHHYGKTKYIEAIQIEMNQNVYLDGYVRPKNGEDLSEILQDKLFKSAKRKLEVLFTALLGFTV